ncbi:MAG TPA: hypothetical protein VF721_13125 [Pyrinomonadaceae bacterium]
MPRRCHNGAAMKANFPDRLANACFKNAKAENPSSDLNFRQHTV